MSYFPHPRNDNIHKVSRMVTLPHWQGFNIAFKMLKEIVRLNYDNNEIRLTSTLEIVHSYQYKSNDWILKSQNIQINTPKTGKIASNARLNVYMETHQYLNSAIKSIDCLNVSYVNIDKEKRKNNNHKKEIVEQLIKQNLLKDAEKAKNVDLIVDEKKDIISFFE